MQNSPLYLLQGFQEKIFWDRTNSKKQSQLYTLKFNKWKHWQLVKDQKFPRFPWRSHLPILLTYFILNNLILCLDEWFDLENELPTICYMPLMGFFTALKSWHKPEHNPSCNITFCKYYNRLYFKYETSLQSLKLECLCHRTILWW